jgi:hypothetical protein
LIAVAELYCKHHQGLELLHRACSNYPRTALKPSKPPKKKKFFNTISAQVAEKVATAVEAIQDLHLQLPAHDIVISNPDIASQDLQDWAFTQGFAFVVETRTFMEVR